MKYFSRAPLCSERVGRPFESAAAKLDRWPHWINKPFGETWLSTGHNPSFLTFLRRRLLTPLAAGSSLKQRIPILDMVLLVLSLTTNAGAH